MPQITELQDNHKLWQGKGYNLTFNGSREGKSLLSKPMSSSHRDALSSPSISLSSSLNSSFMTDPSVTFLQDKTDQYNKRNSKPQSKKNKMKKLAAYVHFLMGTRLVVCMYVC